MNKWLNKYDNGGKKKKFLEPNDPKLPSGRIHPFYYELSSELATSIGGEQGEPAYLIPTFKYGEPLSNPLQEYKDTGEHLGGPFKTWQEADEWENNIRHPYVEKNRPLPSPLKKWGKDYQNGGEMSYYQQGKDFQPKSIGQKGIRVNKIVETNEQSPISKYDDLITKSAEKYDIPIPLFHRLIYEESKHNPNAKSGKGARGLSQITRATADLYKLDKSKLNDPAYNIDAGAKILKAGFDNRKVKDWKDAVGYYNSGNKWFNKKERPKVIAESPEYFKNIFYEIDMLKAIDPTYVQTIEPSIADKTFVAQQKKDGGIVKDNLGYWNPDNWGKAVEIGSPNITMQGVDRELIGVSDEGDTKLLKPGKDYKFKGKKVTEYPIAKYGIHELEQLTNFANNNKPSKNWLNKYST